MTAVQFRDFVGVAAVDQHIASAGFAHLAEGDLLRVRRHAASVQPRMEASAALLEFEKKFPEDDIVLVGADSVAEMTSAFRNYYGTNLTCQHAN